MKIRPAVENDALGIADIYNYYIENTIITFEELPVSEHDIKARMASVDSVGLPWFVAEENGVIIGYAYAAPWKVRTAYRYSVEATVYLRAGLERKGIGSGLYASLFSALKTTDVRIVIGGIALPNEASVALHERFGMEKVAHFKSVGYKFGQWIDVGYWEKDLLQQ